MHCKHFGSCGSCSLYEAGYSGQLQQKKDRVTQLLQPYISFDPNVSESPHSHYRARAEYRIWHDGEICQYAMGNIDKNGHITIDECPKVSKEIEQVMWPLLERINNSSILKNKLFGVEFLSTTTGDLLLTMLYHRKLDNEWETAARQLENILDISIIGRSRKQKVILSRDFVNEELTIDGQVYKYCQYDSGFTQPNPTVNVKIIEWVISRISIDSRSDLLESYCGLGNFTIPLSKLFTKVLATEVSKNSIKAAKVNCELNSVNNIAFVRLSSEEMTQALEKKRIFRRLSHVDLDEYNFSHVLVDPPRAGLDEGTIKLISNIENIIYISCNPETLARDLDTLSHTHSIESSAIFDQFPYSSHIESGVILRSKK